MSTIQGVTTFREQVNFDNASKEPCLKKIFFPIDLPENYKFTLEIDGASLSVQITSKHLTITQTGCLLYKYEFKILD